MPSLGMLTINALTAADSVIIPVQGQYLAAKGLEQLMRTIARVKRQINPHLTVDGILLTMMDSRTTLALSLIHIYPPYHSRSPTGCPAAPPESSPDGA